MYIQPPKGNAKQNYNELSPYTYQDGVLVCFDCYNEVQ